ncbi:hypothetical protein BH10CHL1_BH10CHL1_02920 [soil metagenome]
MLLASFGIVTSNLLCLLFSTLCMAGYVILSDRQDPTEEMTFKPFMLGHAWKILATFAFVLSSVAAVINFQDPFNRLNGFIWLLALLMLVLAAFLHDRTKGWQFTWKLTVGDWLMLAGLTLVAFALRLYRLDGFLPALHGDEGEMGVLALLALHGPASGLSPQPLPLFATAFLDHPTLFHYLQAAAMLVFGETETGLRYLSVIFGALCIPLVYLIGRLGWGRVAGFIAAWLIAVAHLYLQYSRIALNNIETVWFTILFILLLALVYELDQTQIRKKTAQDPLGKADRPLMQIMLAGLTVGISQYFYYGSRLMPVISVLLLLCLWRKQRLSYTQASIFGLAIFVAFAPLAAHYSRDIPAFINRTKGVSIFNAEGIQHVLGAQAVWPRDLPQLFWVQLKNNLNFFVARGDVSTFYLGDLAAFDQLTLYCFWLGLGVVIARARRYHEFSLLVWLGLGLLLAGVFTNNSPNGPRLIVVVVAVYLIAGIFIQNVYNRLVRFWPRGYQAWALLLCCPIAAITLYLNYNTYFIEYARLMPNLGNVAMAHEMADEKQNYVSYLLGSPTVYIVHGVFRFVAYQAEVHDLDDLRQLASLSPRKNLDGGHKGLLFFVVPQRAADLAPVMERFPNGIKTAQFDRLGRLLYTVYRIPATDAKGQPLPAACPTARVDCRNLRIDSTGGTRLSPLSPLH